MLKYRIEEEMQKLTFPQFKYAVRAIPAMLGIANNTFHHYRKLKVDQERDIPYQHIVQLEHFFGINPGSLNNVVCDVKAIHERMTGEEQNFG